MYGVLVLLNLNLIMATYGTGHTEGLHFVTGASKRHQHANSTLVEHGPKPAGYKSIAAGLSGGVHRPCAFPAACPRFAPLELRRPSAPQPRSLASRVAVLARAVMWGVWSCLSSWRSSIL